MTTTINNPHWTSADSEAYQLHLAYDFVAQIQLPLDEKGMNRADLANELKVTPGRVSQVMNNPGNMSLQTMIHWADAVGSKIALVVYKDAAERGENAPVHGNVFRRCWEKLGQPRDLFEINDWWGGQQDGFFGTNETTARPTARKGFIQGDKSEPFGTNSGGLASQNDSDSEDSDYAIAA